MKLFNIERRRKVFIKFIISYLIIFIIPIVFLISTYKNLLNELEKDTHQMNIAILKQTDEILTENKNYMDAIALQMNYNSYARSLVLSNQPLKEAVYSIRKIGEEMAHFLANREEIYIYIKQYDMLISPRGSITRIDLNYGSLLQYGDMTYDAFQEHILHATYYGDFLPMNKVTLDGHKKERLLYVQSLPIDTPFEKKGNFLFFLDGDKVYSLLHKLNIRDGGFSYIQDSKGSIIASSGDFKEEYIVEGLNANNSYIEKDIDKKRFVVSYVTSSETGFTYVSALPYGVLMERVNKIQQKMAVLFLICLLIGIILTYYFSSRNFKPIKEIDEIIKNTFRKQEQEQADEYEYLKEHINQLIINNEEQKHAIESQIPIINDFFISKIMTGDIIEIDNHSELVRKLGLKIEDALYCVVVLDFCGYFSSVDKYLVRELGMKRIVTKEIMKQELKENYLQADIDVDKIGVLFYFNKDEKNVKAYISDKINSMCRVLLEDYQIRLIAGGGSVCNDLLNVSTSCFQAVEALEKLYPNNKICWFEDIKQMDTMYQYTFDSEKKLINYVKAGGKKTVEDIMKKLYKENFVDRTLNYDMTWQLFYELKSTLHRIIQQKKINDIVVTEAIDELSELYKRRYSEHIFEKLEAIFYLICDLQKVDKDDRTKKIKAKMIQYIEENYMDCNIGLCSVAMYLDISEAYLSQFFKEHMGQKFSEYLENKRMDEAVHLLKHTNLPINTVAEKVGYNSGHAFRRAFKRSLGMLPSDCRG